MSIPQASITRRAIGEIRPAQSYEISLDGTVIGTTNRTRGGWKAVSESGVETISYPIHRDCVQALIDSLSPAEPGKCIGRNSSGEPCKASARNGKSTCSAHDSQEPDTAKL